jgi:hypothetical protein
MRVSLQEKAFCGGVVGQCGAPPGKIGCQDLRILLRPLLGTVDDSPG